MPDKVAGNPNVFKEAKARKRGGKACAMPEGPKAKERPRRASGGGVGSNKNPFSSAHKATKG